jgi:hypothetical protein
LVAEERNDGGKRTLTVATDDDLAGVFDREACERDEYSVRLDQ